MITNFKPNTLKNINKFSNVHKHKEKKELNCKNFLIYLILLKNQNKLISSNSIFIKKYKTKIYTILKSPYRHKLARHQINIKRYNIKNTMKIKINNYLLIKGWFNIKNFLKNLKNVNKIFETNLIYSNNIKISIPIKFNNNFYIKNFF